MPSTRTSLSTGNVLTTRRGLALLAGSIGVVLFLAVGAAVGAVPRPGDTDPTAAADSARADDASPKPGPTAPPEPPPTSPPTTVAPQPTAPPTTVKATPRRAPATTAPPAPAVEVAPAPPPPPTTAPKLAPGQRLDPTGAQVQAAMAQLHQRIPLFAPNESQLRTFADAACASFDQGQTFAQVRATVQQAVSNVQGASLSAADADFAVRTVLELRCPGYLP